MAGHNPRARYCIRIARSDIAIDDSADCEACQENARAIRLDPDFAEEFKDYPFPQATG